MDARVMLDIKQQDFEPAAPDTPPEAPLPMPQQGIDGVRAPTGPERDGRWRLAALLVPAMAVTALSASLAWQSMSRDGITPVDLIALVLLTANIAWISIAAATAIAGAVLLAAREPIVQARHTRLSTDSLTAVIFPIRNEDTVRVTAAAQAMHDALAQAGSANAFEIFFLSDTNDAGLAREEEAAIARLRESRPEAAIFYRRRVANHGRKAGNVADFVRRWGGRYDYMAVLDADSLMSAEAMMELVRRMDQRPGTALIQTVPMIVNAHTMIARSQQFAMRAYGQMFGTGLAWWAGGAGNFWGHNAIIRVEAFAANAGLPVLPGNGPLGGHILSHDFVEAALLRRAGWRVEIAPEITGSYEESPPTMDDISTRDRRWAQGNLQHLKLIGARGFDPVSRVHIVAGVMGYGSALLWFSLILVGALQAWLDAGSVHVGGTSNLSLLALSALIVLSPKWLALYLWAVGRLPGWGRNPSFFAGLVLETAVSAAIAPILMVSQARAVIEPFLGRDAGWRPQARVATRVSESANYHVQLACGLALCATMLVNAGFVAWTLPVAASLVFSAPIAAWLAHAPRRRSLLWRTLATPEDLHPPAIVRAARRAAGRFAWSGAAPTRTPATLPVPVLQAPQAASA
jgi:membrane glycosyltransferase